jgi:hypothetical protein
MIDEDYEGDSGKFENVVHTLANVLDGGHKVLIFSQFVKQLNHLPRAYGKGKYTLPVSGWQHPKPGRCGQKIPGR